MQDFSGQVVVITGGAQGIGLATTKAFIAAGGRVVVWDNNPAAWKAATKDLGPALSQVVVAQVDVRDSCQVQRAGVEVLEQESKVDVLINNAGVNFGDQSATGMSDETWDAILNTNLKGAVNTVRALAPGMIDRKRGRIINTGSVLADHPLPLFSGYAASKAALMTLTRAWAQELGPKGITVNAVSPGFIDTPLNAALAPQVTASLIGRTPLRRMGRPEEVANAHLFLASEAAGFINGAVLAVDGGLTI